MPDGRHRVTIPGGAARLIGLSRQGRAGPPVGAARRSWSASTAAHSVLPAHLNVTVPLGIRAEDLTVADGFTLAPTAARARSA